MRDRNLQNTGPTAATVRGHIRRIRDGQGLSLAIVSERLGERGWPMAVSSLSEIENGRRRVDVDDLVVIAAALGVTPITLLMPTSENGKESVEATGCGHLPAERLWTWLRAIVPLPPASRATSLRFWIESWPSWVHDDDDGEDGAPSMLPLMYMDAVSEQQPQAH